ncbi:hypothetical protein MCL27_03700 [Acinetobacter pittii]|uniref:hypothetical protein n=1 Tax=Acinetobacter pittii TaxID=48296 RepID=UPI001EE5F647|nr:hypothetical protein [Acinetobacter pittii]MCG5264131.1 hypothetical protein [Acinetobacter pittii]
MTAKKTQGTTEVEVAQENNDCFIIMPIADHPDYKQGHFKRVYEDIIKPACHAAGYHAVRADDVAQTNLIHLDILQKLLESPMAICDLSTRNPNVLFELGLRQAFDKPTILIQEVGTPQIFDINLFRYTQYRNGLDYRDVLADQKAIQKVIEETKQAVAEKKSVNSIIKLLSITNPATLQDSSNFGDKDYFDILLNEISSIKNQINLSKGKTATIKLNPFPDTYSIVFSVNTEESKITEYFDYLKRLGLISDIRQPFISLGSNRTLSYECEAKSTFQENDFLTFASLFEVNIIDMTLLPF